MSSKKTKYEFEPSDTDKKKTDKANQNQDQSEEDRQPPKPVQPQYPPAFGLSQQQGWGWTPPSNQKQQTVSTPTHNQAFQGFNQQGNLGQQISHSPHEQGQSQHVSTPQNFSQYPQVQNAGFNQQNVPQGQQQHNPYIQGQGQFSNQIGQQSGYQHGYINPNQPFYPQGQGQQGQGAHNYNLPEPNHSPQTPTPQNIQGQRNQGNQIQQGYQGDSPRFGYPQGLLHSQSQGSVFGQSSQFGQQQYGRHHSMMGTSDSNIHMQQGMVFPPMAPHHGQQIQMHHQGGNMGGYSQTQVPYSQEHQQPGLDVHNLQAMQQQQGVAPRQVHPGTTQDIRGTPIGTPSHQIPQAAHPAFRPPGSRPAEPPFFYYSVGYQIPPSHSLGEAPGFERFHHSISEWDAARRHQQQLMGEYHGRSRRADQGREVKDDRDIDRTKEGLRESDKRSDVRDRNRDQDRGQNRGNDRDSDRDYDRGRDRDYDRNRNRDRDWEYERDRNRYHDSRYQYSDRYDSDRTPEHTSSEDDHHDDRRRINPRNFDTRYPENVGPYIPYHPYPPGVHVPSPARHLGGAIPPMLPSHHNISPMVLPTPPNTPLNQQYMNQQHMQFHGHMPHVPIPGPYDSPFAIPDFLAHRYPYPEDYYDDRDSERRRERERRRRREMRRTPSPSPERMNVESKDDDDKDIKDKQRKTSD